MHWDLARGKRKPKLHQKASHTQCTRTYPHHVRHTCRLQTHCPRRRQTRPTAATYTHPPLPTGCEDQQARVSQLIVIVAQQGQRWGLQPSESRPQAAGAMLPSSANTADSSRVATKVRRGQGTEVCAQADALRRAHTQRYNHATRRRLEVVDARWMQGWVTREAKMQGRFEKLREVFRKNSKKRLGVFEATRTVCPSSHSAGSELSHPHSK
jgi:hypothetical protein